MSFKRQNTKQSRIGKNVQHQNSDTRGSKNLLCPELVLQPPSCPRHLPLPQWGSLDPEDSGSGSIPTTTLSCARTPSPGRLHVQLGGQVGPTWGTSGSPHPASLFSSNKALPKREPVPGLVLAWLRLVTDLCTSKHWTGLTSAWHLTPSAQKHRHGTRGKQGRIGFSFS